jgi:hypothetical protein
MYQDDIDHCRARIVEEEQQAATAASWETRLTHAQMAMLYKAQLATLVQGRREYEACNAAC